MFHVIESLCGLLRDFIEINVACQARIARYIMTYHGAYKYLGMAIIRFS